MSTNENIKLGLSLLFGDFGEENENSSEHQNEENKNDNQRNILARLFLGDDNTPEK